MNLIDPKESLAARLTACLDATVEVPPSARKQAAVVLALTDAATPRLLLIRRSLALSLHPGEIALPGGKLEPTDADLRAAALREAFEEVALPANRLQLYGSLGCRISMSGLSVAAFVGIMPANLALRADPNEVEELIFAPLTFFADVNNLRVDHLWHQGTPRVTGRYQYQEHTVWGMTGGFIIDLVQRLYGIKLDIHTLKPAHRRGSVTR